MIDFLQSPGPRERQLQRAHNNPLFKSHSDISIQQLEQARQLDSEDMQEFVLQFQKDVEAAVNLKPQADADDVLALKAKLEVLYTQACGLQGERDKFKAALKQLLELISRSLVSAANNDPEAMKKISDDQEATELHLQISESLLAADIINKNEIINQDQLAASLLSSSEDELATTLLIFAPEQLEDITQQAAELLEASNYTSSAGSEPEKRLAQLQQWSSTKA